MSFTKLIPTLSVSFVLYRTGLISPFMITHDTLYNTCSTSHIRAFSHKFYVWCIPALFTLQGI